VATEAVADDESLLVAKSILSMSLVSIPQPNASAITEKAEKNEQDSKPDLQKAVKIETASTEGFQPCLNFPSLNVTWFSPYNSAQAMCKATWDLILAPLEKRQVMSRHYFPK